MVPDSIIDQEMNRYGGMQTLPSTAGSRTFKTLAVDESSTGTQGGRPEPLFCIVEDPNAPTTVGKTSGGTAGDNNMDAAGHAFQTVGSNFNVLLGFTEAVRLDGGYTTRDYTFNLASTTTQPQVCASTGYNNGLRHSGDGDAHRRQHSAELEAEGCGQHSDDCAVVGRLPPEWADQGRRR